MTTTTRRYLFGAPAAQPKIEFRSLGKTGMRVSSLGFGCMTTSDAMVIERAADIGINYFDTARAYQNGNNERLVGTALKGRRDKVFISSKTLAKTRADALKDLDTSLRELQTDHLDVWFLHSRSTPEELSDELLDAQDEARKAGKIRFRGVTFHFNMPQMLDHVVRRGRTDVALAAYNFTMKPDVTAAIETARRSGLGVVAMKALGGSFTRIERGDRLYGVDPGALTKTLKQPGAILAAVKYALKNKSVDTAIVCMTDFDQLDENLRAMAEPWSDADRKLLAAQLLAIAPIYCRMCGHCGGACPKGIPVPDVLRILTYAEGYRQFPMARQRYLELPEIARSGLCNACPVCTHSCPNGVQVRQRVLRAQELLA